MHGPAQRMDLLAARPSMEHKVSELQGVSVIAANKYMFCLSIFHARFKEYVNLLKRFEKLAPTIIWFLSSSC